jgi:hypothetical protein
MRKKYQEDTRGARTQILDSTPNLEEFNPSRDFLANFSELLALDGA